MKEIARWVAFVALFAIPFLPLYVADGMFFPFITGKGFAFRILVEIAAVAWLFLALLDAKYRPRFSWIFVLYAALVVWMLIANFFAVNPHKAFWSNYERMDGWITLAHVFLLFVVSSSILSVHTLWNRWWLTFLGGSALVCLYGLLQIADVLQTHQGDRIDASFGNAAYLPAYLLFGIAISLWQGFQRKGWLRYSLFFLSAVQVFILLFTATRGALFGLIGAIVFSALVYAWQSKKGRLAAGGVIVGVVLIATGFFVIKDSTFVRESQTLNRLSSVFSLSEELQVRFKIWDIGLKGFMDQPVTGYGHEGFIYPFNTYYTPELFAQEQWFDRAHNIYLDWLIAGGAPALLLFVALMIYASFVMLRKEFSVTERVFILGAFAAYAIQGVVVFDNLFTYVPLAMLLAFIHARIAKPISFIENAPEIARTQLYGVAGVVVVFGAVCVWFINMPSIQGSQILINSFKVAPASMPNELARAITSGSFATQEIREQMVARTVELVQQPAVANETKIAMASLAITEMGKEIARAPNDARLRLQYATAYRAVGDMENALKQIDAALAVSPKKQTILLEKGTLLLGLKQYTQARDVFYTAHTLDTSFALPAAYLAAGEVFVGNMVEAQRILDRYYDETLTEAPQTLFFALTETGNTDVIIAALRARADKAGRTPESLLQVVAYLGEIQRFAEAEKEIDAIVAEHPNVAGFAKDWRAQLEALKK